MTLGIGGLCNIVVITKISMLSAQCLRERKKLLLNIGDFLKLVLPEVLW